MRRLVLGALTLLGSACVPFDPYWLIAEPRYVGLRLSVVEPGGYASLLNVPAGQLRTGVLPLDTFELEWFVATPPGVTVAPPIWVLCGFACEDVLGPEPYALELRDCEHPLPFFWWQGPCRLGEGDRIRVSMGGAATVYGPSANNILVVGSRDPEVSPATCLERLVTRPSADLYPCLVGLRPLPLGPYWAFGALPFSPESEALPPELLYEAADTHPEVTGFRVTRMAGAGRVEVLAAPGETVTVRPGERIIVDPIFVEGAAQDYFKVANLGDPGRQTITPEIELITLDAWITAIVDDFVEPEYFQYDDHQVRFTVPAEPEPATLYVDVRDDRNGRAFASLRFVAEDLEASP